MNRIQELLNELCPNGVKFSRLNEVSEMKRGTGATKKTLNAGQVPVISGGKEPAYYTDRYNRKGDIITVAGSGANAGYVKYWNIPIFSCDSFTIKGNQNIKTKFLYYYLSAIQDKIYATKTGGGIPHVHISNIESFIVPVPPIEVQNEIVRILDNFTKLETELETELEARKEQYSYYFSKLMNSNQYRKIKLSEIGKVKMCKRILKNQTTPKGDIPFYKIGTFGKKADAYISEETFKELKAKYSYPKKGDILISCSGTIGRTVVFDGKPAYFQDSNIVWLEHDETIITNSFLKYCYSMSPWRIATGGTIARLYNDNILNAEVLVPTLDEQERIVSILDRFDKLCNDISEGLPAEIEARRKQYEYYRDKLLNFKELKVENKE